MRHPDTDHFPLRGHVIINAVVIVLTLTVWFAVKRGLFLYPPVEAAGRPGVAAMLALVPLCFLLASAFDIVWRAIGRRRDMHRKASESIASPPSSTSVRRDMPSREVEKV